MYNSPAVSQAGALPAWAMPTALLNLLIASFLTSWATQLATLL
jgi:hypothetical protein